MEKFIGFLLARLKAVAGAVGLAVAIAFVNAVDAELLKNFGFALPEEIKLPIMGAITGFFINFTPNVKLVEEGVAKLSPSVPVERKAD